MDLLSSYEPTVVHSPRIAAVKTKYRGALELSIMYGNGIKIYVLLFFLVICLVFIASILAGVACELFPDMSPVCIDDGVGWDASKTATHILQFGCELLKASSAPSQFSRTAIQIVKKLMLLAFRDL